LCVLLCGPGYAQAPAGPPPPDGPQPATTQAAPAPATPTIADQAKQLQRTPVSAESMPFHVQMPHSHNPFGAYMASDAPPFSLSNSARLSQLIRDGKLYLSLTDAIALALENNLDLAYARYNTTIAETDLARTKAGGFANGVNVGVISSTQGGQGNAFGGGAGSSSGGAGSASSSSGSAGSAGGAGGLVQSTLGQGTQVHAFDPVIFANGWVDHTTQQLTNAVTVGGIPIYQQNTIEGQMEYQQYFPLGTNIQFYYTGLRQTTNSQATNVNPILQSQFQFFIFQPLLAGFGLATNTRYIHIARNNQKLTDLGFKSQVISTITQVQNIYWDLVNAYEDEQVKERSLQFANKTLEDDNKQLELQAIPAMQVLKDQAQVATAEGDLTVAKATLRLNELYIKNALTKTIDDPGFEEMPVVPTDRMGGSDENADRQTEELIAQAQKTRPDLAMDQISMETAQTSLRTIKNELLPSLSLYGEYAGIGNAGQPNPNCNGCPPPTGVPTGFGGSFQNAFNYSSPEYQVGFELTITLRNRIAKADQFRSVIEYRQREIQFETQKKNIRFDVRNSQFALQQARARVTAAQKARDLAENTFETTRKEQDLGAKSSYETLTAQHDLAVQESALSTAQAAYEKAKVDMHRALGDTLEHDGIQIDDARAGVVTGLKP
jgi:outer membrane protein TolC